MSDRPEHEKLRAVRRESQVIGGFLEWLTQGQRLFICERDDYDYDCYDPILFRSDELLARYLGVDLAKLNAEKDAMVAELQAAANGPKEGSRA